MSDADVDAQVIAHLRELQQRTVARPDPPPLRIHHLMACAVVAAIELSLLRFTMGLSAPQQSVLSGGIFGFSQVINAIGLTLTGFSIYWWRKGYAAFSQPGQMLLLQYAASLMMYFVTMAFVLMMRLAGGASPPPSWFSWLPMMLSIGSLIFGVLLPIVFYGWCAWKIADTWSWRLLFILCALTSFLTPTLSILLMQSQGTVGPRNFQTAIGLPYLIRGTVLLAAGILVVATDATARRQRSWTHWAGIILWLFSQIGTLLLGVFYLFVWKIS